MLDFALDKIGRLQLDHGTLLAAYRTMKTIREFEERLHIQFAAGEIPGFVHLYAGEEAIATACACTFRTATASQARTGGTDTASRRAVI